MDLWQPYPTNKAGSIRYISGVHSYVLYQTVDEWWNNNNSNKTIDDYNTVTNNSSCTDYKRKDTCYIENNPLIYGFYVITLDQLDC